jgi:hypothetical protein
MVGATATVRAAGPDLIAAIPPDALAVAIVDAAPAADGEPRSPASDLAAWAAMAVAGRTAPTAIAEIATAVARLRSYPWSVALLDVRARALGAGSYKLAELSAVLVVHTRGENAAVTQDIQAALERWTTSDTARIETIETNGVRNHVLIDERLPGWAKIQWGAVDAFYIIAIGRDAFAKTAANIAGGTRRSRGADDHARLLAAADVRRARVAWSVRLAALRAALGEVIAGKPQRVLAELGLDRTVAAAWTLGREDRAVVARMARLRGRSVEVVSISQSVEADPALRPLVPAEATAYACIPHRPAELIERAASAWLASRRPDARTAITNAFRQFEREAGVDVRADLLDQLGSVVLIHNFPAHPARLPLANTILVEVAGSTDRVRTSLDKLLLQCALWLRPTPNDASNERTPFWSPRLERLDDGVWTLRAGLYGPAIVVHDGWIVIGYAPSAVRQNIAALAARSGSHR